MAVMNRVPSDAQSRIRAMSERRDNGGGTGKKSQVIVGTGIDTALARLNACGGGSACVPSNCPPGYAPSAAAGTVGADPMTGLPTGWPGGSGCCAPPCNSAYRVAYVGAVSASVADAASTTLSIVPIVATKTYKLFIPAGVSWRLTSIKVGTREYLDGGVVSGAVFGDMNMDSGRLETDWFSSSTNLIISATNVSGGALLFNPTIIGFVSNL